MYSIILYSITFIYIVYKVFVFNIRLFILYISINCIKKTTTTTTTTTTTRFIYIRRGCTFVFYNLHSVICFCFLKFNILNPRKWSDSISEYSAASNSPCTHLGKILIGAYAYMHKVAGHYRPISKTPLNDVSLAGQW